MTSVTRIIHTNPQWNAYGGVPIPPGTLEKAAERGRKVQTACYYWDAGELDWYTVDDGLVGYVEAWIQLRKDRPDLEVICHEFEVTLPNGVVGHPDMLCRLDGRIVLPDLKCTVQELLAHRIQVSVYVNGKMFENIKASDLGLTFADCFQKNIPPILIYLKDARKVTGKPYRLEEIPPTEVQHHYAAFLAQCRRLEDEEVLSKHAEMYS